MNKRKIMILIPSLGGGGAERTLVNLLNKVDYTKYEIDVISVLGKGVYINQLPADVKLFTLFNNEFFYRVLAWLQSTIGFFILQRIIFNHKIRKRYDVGISYLDSSFTAYLFFNERFKKRIAWVHAGYKTNNNFYKRYKIRRYTDKLIWQRYGRLDGIYFVSHDAMMEFIEIFGEFKNMRVVYNPINTETVKQKAQEKCDFYKTKFTFIAVGSLTPVKGYDRLLRSARIVSDQGYDFDLIILGTGSEESRLKNMTSDLNLADKVHWLGFRDNPYPFVRIADVFMMSSLSEALPTVLCEAMVLHKPTIVTNCCGCREIVNNGEFGLMAEQDDVDLAEKMLLFLKNKDLLDYYKQKSIERSVLFDDKKSIEEYYRVFDL